MLGLLPFARGLHSQQDRYDNNANSPSATMSAETSTRADMPSTLPSYDDKMAATSGVAIIGMSFTLPCGIKSPQALWEFCKARRCATAPIPKERFEASHYYHPVPTKKGHFNVKGGSFLSEDIATFDAPFFNLTEAEAQSMDPQHRLTLEGTFAALENAGLDMRSLAGRSDVGVFAAGSKADSELGANLDAFTANRYTVTGNALTMFANRLSYFFNWRGPSIVVDVACASGLTAISLASESIRRGECSVAIVAGAFLQLSPTLISHMGGIGALGKDGKSYSYDHRAEGYGRGEGVCCIVLKSEQDAQRAADCIRAVIRGSGINHCGRSQGITFPNGQAQVELIHRVYREAGLDPHETVVVEGHGTGTAAGDPIEVRSIATAFGGERSLPLYLSSIKANFGHLEAASGVLAVIKSVLMLERGAVLPSANYKKPNPAVVPELNLLQIPTETIDWPAGAPRRVSINNFGFGGSNAHMILEAAPSTVDSPQMGMKVPAITRLFPFSAKDPLALTQHLKIVAQHVESLDLSHGDEEAKWLQNLSYTLCCGRTQFDYQRAIAAKSLSELVESLKALASASEPRRVVVPQSVILVFTGQGAQWAGVGAELMRLTTFAESMRKADDFLRRELGAAFSLLEEILEPEETSRIGTAVISQPACTAVQLSLMALLKSYGVMPRAVCGHSSGEIAAAFAAGFVDFETAMALAYYRGEVSTADSSGPPGAMLAVGASAEAIEPMLENVKSGRLALACFNSPTSITISGDREAIMELKGELDPRSTFARLLKVDRAYHSHQMIEPGRKYLDKITPWLKRNKEPQDTGLAPMFFSSVHKTVLEREDVTTPQYWTDNLVNPVRFNDAMSAAVRQIEMASVRSPVFIIEVGPHPALAGPVRDICKASAQGTPKYFSTLTRKQDGYENMLSLSAALFSEAIPLDIAQIGTSTTTASQTQLLTDLPSYQFNHTRRYWHSGRMQQNVQHGTSPWNVLLGHKVPFTIGDTLEFRNVFSLDDIPWLRDHHINGSAVFPMAGYMSAVLEALRFQHARASPIVRFKLREMSIGRAFRLAEGQTYELFTTLQSKDSGSRGSVGTSWFSFKIQSWTEESGFVEHCTGFAATVCEDEGDTISTVLSIKAKWSAELRERLQTGRTIAPDAFYRKTADAGMKYGEAFRLVTQLSTGREHATGTVRAINTAKLMPEGFEPELAMHPTFLDACLQIGLCNTAGSKGELGKLRAFVPTFIEETVIAAGIPQDEGDLMQVYYHDIVHDAMSRSSSANMTAFSDAKDERAPVLEFRGVKLVNVSEETAAVRDVEIINPQKVEWVDHPQFLTSESAQQLIAEVEDFNEEQEKLPMLEAVAIKYMRQALEACEDVTPREEHLVHFKKWMGERVANASRDLPEVPESQPGYRDLDWLDAIGPHIAAVLKGDTHPLSVLQEAGLNTVYDESFIFGRSAAISARLLRNLSFQNPSLRILEVGAGTGAGTNKILHALNGRFESYVYTDISRAFLEPAKNKFSRWADKMTFTALDLLQDPVKQGLEPASFDVIIAADVIHAVPSITESLKHIRSLLKPGGALVMLEIGNFAPCYFPFAMLPGFWNRETGPCLSKDEWQAELSQAGFEDNTVMARDWSKGRDMHLIVYARSPLEEPELISNTEITILRDEAVTGQIAGSLEKSLAGYVKPSLSLESLEDAAKIQGQHCILLEDMRRPTLTNISKTSFDALKTVVGNAAGILWVVTTDSAQDEQIPIADFAIGFGRTIRLEYNHLKFVVLHIADADCATVSAITSRIFQHTFIDHPGVDESEVEFRYSQGRLLFPRLLPDEPTRSYIDSTTNQDKKEMQPLWEQKTPVHATMHQLGLFDSLHFQPTKFKLDDPIPDEEVLVWIRATGLNFKDVLLCLGRVPWQDIGLECSGEIMALGAIAGQSFRVGDRVALYGRGGLFGSHARCHMDTIVKVPDHLTFPMAASVLLVFGTAYESLVNVARLQPGEKVLIHAAAGGVGQAAIILAQYLQAEIYCTVGTPEKRKLLVAQYKIPEDRVFSSRTTEFAEGVRSATNGEGVDVVLNSLTGDLLQASWQCITPYGRFVEIGKRDALANARLDMAMFDKSVTFTSVDLALMSNLYPKRASKMLKDVMALFEKRHLRPVAPIKEFVISDLVQALRLLQSGKHVGKVVITNDANAKVPVGIATTRTSVLRADASYLITGGPGGLGRSFARWMIDHGARCIVLVSRSGRTGNRELSELSEYAESNNATVQVVRCDVTRNDQIAGMLRAIRSEGLPPIRGIVHGAMYLKDALFENTTHDDFQAIQKPKIAGAMNLHRIFDGPDDVDFFICLSSIAGISGNMGQTAYSGSSAFLDAFCRWRGSKGLPAASISLPAISDAGYVAEAMAVGQVNFTEKVYGASLTESQLQLALDAAMRRECFNPKGNSNGCTIGLSGSKAFAEAFGAAGPLISVLCSDSDTSQSKSGSGQDGEQESVKDLLSEAKDTEEKHAILLTCLTKKLADMMMMPIEELTPERAIADMGVDSLVAVELRNWIAKELQASILVMDIVGCRSLLSLRDLIVAKSGWGDGVQASDIDGIDQTLAETKLNAV